MSELVKIFHNYRPQPILVQLGPIFIYFYGVLIVFAIIFGFYLTWKLIKKYRINISFDELVNLTIYLIIFGLIGARLYHVLTEINYYIAKPWEIFYFWQGGLGIFGALIANFIFLFFYGRKRGYSLWFILDLLAPALLLGEAIGRFGNWFNQENFGYPTSLAWGIPIELIYRPIQYVSFEYFHPTFFYQFIWNIFVLIFLIFIIKKIKMGRGLIFGWYLVLYSLGRFIIEFLRVNYQPMILDLRLAQLVCLLLFASGLYLIFFRKTRKLSTIN
ncbi:MAG: prolipoprotein diacylglyceryl transferase [Patescibacteria group bacterium]|nr:prolipoprotein diacylglyceryl transferase [Patescibacteria group bacterium]MDD5121103.1 prolipoprotein diacylglyceryl transferase [Patescibacteria group bacterium]MDD5221925.1 prolipoprotein diacylglyceryl transferase [Patescibacteria group bacterium]MDD5395978.1 prolipoprotein diacylglyceryl transferase [Patescibacteria group bacterium]